MLQYQIAIEGKERYEMRGTQNSQGGDLLTVHQAARVLNCKPSLLYRLVETGRIPHVRLGRLLRFPPDISERMIQGGPNSGGGGE